MNTQPLIETADALNELSRPGVKFADATWHMPNVPINAYETYLNEHIPGAVNFDIDKVANHAIDLPHMYPSLEYFESSMSELGISSSDNVIVYDRSTLTKTAERPADLHPAREKRASSLGYRGKSCRYGWNRKCQLPRTHS